MDWIDAGRTKYLLMKRTREDAILPTRAHTNDAGLDLYAPENLTAHMSLTIDIGVALAIPDGFAGVITSRSSQNKNGLTVPIGIIDSGYRGSIKVVLRAPNSIACIRGERIAQLLIVPIALSEPLEVAELPHGVRGENGWGSTGK